MEEFKHSHSQKTTTLSLDLKMDDVKNLEEPFITDSNNRSFRIKTALLYGMIHVLLCTWTFYYLSDTDGSHRNIKQWFLNYEYIGSGYDIAVTCIFILSLLLLSFWYRLAKSIAGYGLVTLIILSYAYLIGYILRITCKTSINLDEEICKVYVALWCAGFGLLIATVMPSSTHRKGLGILIGSVFFFVMLILWRFVFKMDNPKLHVTAMYVAGFAFYSWYINEALSIMVTKRLHIYTANDWPIAFGHLQTDIFCMFWVDLFCYKKPVIVDEQFMENDFEMRIAERGDGPKDSDLAN